MQATQEFSARHHDRDPLFARLALAGAGVLAVAAIAYALWPRQTSTAIDEARAWTIAGPPCPAISAPAYLQVPFRATQAFNFDDVVFARAFGHVSCAEIKDDGGRGLGDHPVCQFTSPGVLRITTRAGDSFFYPQTGPATVSVEHGKAQCVLASKFKG